MEPAYFETTVYGRFMPEHYGDFAWENNKIAFRIYGKALEKVEGQNSWGIDTWGKRTSPLVSLPKNIIIPLKLTIKNN